MLNTPQRVGGSLGTAILAVVLQHEIAARIGNHPGGGGAGQALPPAVRAKLTGPLADAFAASYWWALGVTAVALVPAAVLAWVQDASL